MKYVISRREFITHSIGGALGLLLQSSCSINNQRPNIVFVFADEWRAQATGYMGNKEVITPHLDTLASESILFKTAVSGCPVCSPYRGSLLTGQYPPTHGVFYNDKPLRESALTIAKLFKASGYNTGYIGKWHLNGHDKKTARSVGRSSPVPKARRHGFDFWKVRECTHDYNHSYYFDENNDKHFWEGYDAIAQTREARKYILPKTHLCFFFPGDLLMILIRRHRRNIGLNLTIIIKSRFVQMYLSLMLISPVKKLPGIMHILLLWMTVSVN